MNHEVVKKIIKSSNYFNPSDNFHLQSKIR